MPDQLVFRWFTDGEIQDSVQKSIFRNISCSEITCSPLNISFKS